jgi:transposase
MEVLNTGIVKRWIMPHVSKGSRGPETTVETADISGAVFYRLKTGCQWRMLSLNEFFGKGGISYRNV